MGLFPLGLLSQGGGAGVLNFFYVASGDQGAAPFTTIDKLNMTAETSAALGTGLSTPRGGTSGASNGSTAGYVMGGNTGSYPSPTNLIAKCVIASDAISNLGNTLSSSRVKQGGFSNVGTAGYVGGGLEAPGYGTVATMNKLAFSGETVSTLGSGLSATRYGMTGFANKDVAGYAAGGNGTTTVDKFAFPGDSRSTLATGLSSNRQESAAIANAAVAGYHLGGYDGASFTTTVDKFAFPSDTRSTLGTGLPVVRGYHTAGSNNGTNAVYGGGSSNVSNLNTYVKLLFATDAFSTLSATMSSQRRFVAGFSTGTGA
jgi:hypothetical protein